MIFYSSAHPCYVKPGFCIFVVMQEDSNKDKYMSYQWNKLSNDAKDKAEAILSYLVGMNTKEASDLLSVVKDELDYRSTVTVSALS